MHTGKNSHQFLGITFSDRTDSPAILRFGITDEIETIIAILGIKSVAGAHILKLDRSSDVAGTELIHLRLNASAHTIELRDTFFRASCHVVKIDTWSKRTRHHLEIADLTDMRLHSRLEEI